MSNTIINNNFFIFSWIVYLWSVVQYSATNQIFHIFFMKNFEAGMITIYLFYPTTITPSTIFEHQPTKEGKRKIKHVRTHQYPQRPRTISIVRCPPFTKSSPRTPYKVFNLRMILTKTVFPFSSATDITSILGSAFADGETMPGVSSHVSLV